MGLLYIRRLHGAGVYSCSSCETPLALKQDLLSTHFRGRTGTACLFDNVINVFSGEPEETQMTTGLHVIRTIHCVKCCENLGWTYIKAYSESQKYKEGRFILEEELIRQQPDENSANWDPKLLGREQGDDNLQSTSWSSGASSDSQSSGNVQ
ncbi:unnamed protein product [Amoebophrya sp. A120]|nr:unnamed protein product [Amoebophrya sp. A120]|eukprot:GSA120T00005498001.1